MPWTVSWRSPRWAWRPLAIVCFFAVILARPLGVTDFSEGIWPLIVVFPAIALPLAFVMIVVLLIMSFVRRARANRES